MAVYVPVISSFDGRGINKAIRDFKNLKGGAERTAYGLRTLDAAAVKVAKVFAKVGGASLALGGVAVKQFMDFDSAMTKSLAIMGDVSDVMKKQMSDAARQMAKETTFSATEAAESYFFLASAGLNAEQSVAALPRVAKFAQAGMFSMALATDLLTDAQSALGLTIRTDTIKNMQNMARVSDVLVKANTLANATVEQFSKSLTNKAGAALRSANKDIEEGVAVLSAFADQGIKGEEAGTQFAIVMRDLQTRALKNADAFKAANVQVYDQQGNMNNLGKIIQQLEKRLGGMSTAQKRAELATLGFTDKSVAAITALLGTSDAIMNYEKELRNASGTTEEIAAKQLTSLSAQLNLAKSSFQDLAISLGERLAPVVREATFTLKNFATIVGEEGIGAGITFLIGKTTNAIASMGAWGKVILTVTGAFIALRVATITYNTTFMVLDATVRAFNLTLNATRVALVAAGGVTALLAVAGAAYMIYAGRKAKAVQTTKDFREALRLEGKEQDNALWALYERDKAFRAQIDTMMSLGYTLKDVSKFVETGTGGLSRFTSEWETNKSTINKTSATLDDYRKALGLSKDANWDTINGIDAFVASITEQRKMSLKSADAALILARASGDANKVLVANVDAMIASGVKLGERGLASYNRAKAAIGGIGDAATDAEEETETAFGNMGKTIETAAQRFKKFVSALKGYGADQRSYNSAIKNTEKSKKNLTKVTEELTKAQEHYDRVVKGFGAGSKEAVTAQEELEKAQRDAARAGFDLERSQVAVTKAEQELARVMADPASTAQDIREAEIELAESRMTLTERQIGLREATQEVNDAQLRLNETISGAAVGSDTYKSAQEKLADAQDKYSEAVDRVTEAVDREAEAKLRLAHAERELRKARGEVTQDQVKRAEKQTGVKSVSKKSRRGAKGKAVGGSVMAGQPYIVGERGRELFMPSQSGSIVPNNRMPQGDTYNIIVNSKIADESLPDLIVAELRKFNRRSGAIKIQVA